MYINRSLASVTGRNNIFNSDTPSHDNELEWIEDFPLGFCTEMQLTDIPDIYVQSEHRFPEGSKLSDDRLSENEKVLTLFI